MKQSFEIYPPLLRITPLRNRKTPGINLQDFQNNFDENKRLVAHDVSFPHLFYGDCIVNPAHTLVTLTHGNVLKAAAAFDIPDSILNQLNSQTFQGKQYVITYVPVMN